MSAYGHNGHSISRHRNSLPPNISEPSLDLIGGNPDHDPFDTMFPCAPSFVCLCPSLTVDQTPTSRLKTPTAVSQRDWSYHGLIIRTFNVVLIDQTMFSLRLHSVPHTSPFETFCAQSRTNSSKFSYSPRMRSRKPGEVTDQRSTLGLFSRYDESSK